MFRRVVTGHVGNKSTIVADSAPPRTHVLKATPGMATSYLWATHAQPKVPGEPVIETFTEDIRFLPGVGETRFIYLQVAPDSVLLDENFDPAAAGAEMMALQPEMAATMELENPGMHRTQTIDYVIVLDGEIYLEVDDEEEVRLTTHDVVIQNGTRHAWRNKSGKPTLLAVVLIGAAPRPA